MPDSTTIEQLMVDIRKMPVSRQLIPMEAGIGWPIPTRKEGQVFVTFPFFGVSRVQPQRGETQLFPPFAKMTLDWQTRVPVEYVNLHYQDPWPGLVKDQIVGTFPHAAVAGISVQEYRTKRGELLHMYDELCATLQSGGALTAEWNARFSALLRELVEPSLEPYYRVLGPAFFERFLPSA
jgi:hypothetical protein